MNHIDIVGMILLLISTYILGKRNNNGWLVSIGGAICFTIAAWEAELLGIFLFELIYIAMAVVNYIRGLSNSDYDQVGWND